MKEQVLRGIPLFAALPDAEIARLAATLREVVVPAGALLMHEGDHGDHLYILLEGQVEAVKALGSREERSFGVKYPGEIIGEISLLNPGSQRTASVRVRGAARLLEMSRADFDALLRREPTFAYELARVLSMRLQASDAATIRDLQAKNRELEQAYRELQAAQAQIIEKERLERELAVARRIQLSMLPRTLPRVEGFDFAALTIPAHAVGGDFYDFIVLGDDRLGIVVGDVMGKGVGAALFMAATRSLLREEAVRTGTPQAVLENVNEQLLQMNDEGVFVTVLYGVLQRTTRDFVYARAGHELPLLIDASGAVMTLPRGQGVPLAIMPDLDLDEQTVTMTPGSTLVLYTDGVTDTTNGEGTCFGPEQLREVLKSSHAAPAQQICDTVLQAVRLHQGAAPQADDVTLVAVCSCSTAG